MGLEVDMLHSSTGGWLVCFYYAGGLGWAGPGIELGVFGEMVL